MYRDNEAGRVAAVREAAGSGDRAAMIAAALEFWLAPREGGGDGPDVAARDVWQVIADACVTTEACDAALIAIRDGRRLRPHAYVDIVEHVTAPEVLGELLDLALARGWPAVPYLAAPCFALVDARCEDALWKRIVRHSLALSQALDRWMLVGTILTISAVGRRDDLDRWFANWAMRRPPMWVVCNWLCTRLHLGASTIELFGDAQELFRSAGSHDATRALPLATLLVDDLRHADLAAFFAHYEDRDALDWPFRDHPMIAYVNASKHRRKISEVDLDYRESDLGAAITRPTNWRVPVLLRAAQPLVAQVAMVAPLFPRLRDAPARSAEAAAAYRAMRTLPANSIRPVAKRSWDALAHDKVSAWQRFAARFR